ncbi:MAG: Serine/threonine kinase [Myxococcaceae bacterium]|nr:Serine/threonine kinase [Myxococcaceae bacterium]MEA2748146.1 eukaryotic-like serine/threonine-protein kinase [Myxococcales bacterium]
MRCLDENVLSEHLARRLGGAETERVTSHLDACAACADLMMDLARIYPAEPTLGEPTAVGPSLVSPGTRAATEADAPPAAIGRYVVLAPVGAGGMGVVYAAYDPKLDRKVAIKLLRTRAGNDDTSQGEQRKLMLEARTMARVSHPNVLVVHDVGSHDGQVFLVADFVDGGTLRAWLAREKRSLDAILGVMVQAARGLAAAHKAGLVHRDFKPDNVLVSRDERVYVADFGLTCATPAPGGGDRPAGGYVTAGTPAYMAPEVKLGVEADARSDQYSFCVTLQQATASDSTLPEELRAVLRRGLAEQAAARFASMDEVIAALSPRARARVPSFAPALALALGVLLAGGIAAGITVKRSANANENGNRNLNINENPNANENGTSNAIPSALALAPPPSAVIVATPADDGRAPAPSGAAVTTPARSRGHVPPATARGRLFSYASSPPPAPSPAPSADPLGRHY